MSVYADGVKYRTMHLPCGGVAYFDDGAGYGYRCECGSVVGSVGMPRACRSEIAKYDVLKQLGSNVKWDYNKGCEVTE
jgi:hypothetical protein